MIINPFAFWLTPARKFRVAVNDIIQNLAHRYDAPVFEPHVTLFVGNYVADDDLLALGEQISRGQTAVQLQLQEIGYTDLIFKTLFISFADHDGLTDMVEYLKANLQQPGDYRLQPHLSLIYKEMAVPVKQKIIRELDINEPVMTFDAIKLVAPGDSHDWGQVNEWRIIESWHLS